MTAKKENSKSEGFTKQQLLGSKKYKGVDKDIMNVLLKDEERYTHVQVKKLIADFKTRKVK